MHSTHGVVESESESTWPGSHALHVVPPQLAYVPFGQVLHEVPGFSSTSAVPGAHDSHAADPLPAYWPVEHASHLSSYKFADAAA